MKPRVKTKCVANSYAASDERIVEFSNGSRTGLRGGLIALRNCPDGKLLLNVYETDPGVIVKTDADAAVLTTLKALVADCTEGGIARWMPIGHDPRLYGPVQDAIAAINKEEA